MLGGGGKEAGASETKAGLFSPVSRRLARALAAGAVAATPAHTPELAVHPQRLHRRCAVALPDAVTAFKALAKCHNREAAPGLGGFLSSLSRTCAHPGARLAAWRRERTPLRTPQQSLFIGLIKFVTLFLLIERTVLRMNSLNGSKEAPKTCPVGD